ncbi:MAG: Do family serine endopeptidase [Muribaculaceae bacterium]|nr:Do family serine endopeptidase [Muribaculaceae bacterium]
MKTTGKLFLALLAAAVLGSTLTVVADNYYVRKEDKNFIRTSNRIPSSNTDFTVAAENTINCVVSIKSYASAHRQYQGNRYFDPFEFFFGPGFGGSTPRQQQQQPQQEEKLQPLGLGSGVIISSDGYIVTNNHVIKGAEKLEVTLNNNEKYVAKVIGSDADTDLALLKVDANDLSAITFGDSDALKVGEWVLAVGNPFGFTSTVTAGIVSAKARNIGEVTSRRANSIDSFIQTDAAVNQGNSGGALVNINGELVGINTAIYSQTGNYAGYSFAIPSSTVSKVVKDLKEYGSVQRAVLGVTYQPLTAELAKEKGITATSEGLYIASVNERSAAMQAGLQEGDVIIKMNGTSVKNSGQLLEQMNKLRPGDNVEITYIRDNKTHTTTATLRNDQGNTKLTKSSSVSSLGCGFLTIDDEKKKELQINNGVEVVSLKAGKFRNAGIKEGFVITEINSTPVNSRDDVESIYNSIMSNPNKRKVMIVIGYHPNGTEDVYAVKLTD